MTLQLCCKPYYAVFIVRKDCYIHSPVYVDRHSLAYKLHEEEQTEQQTSTEISDKAKQWTQQRIEQRLKRFSIRPQDGFSSLPVQQMHVTTAVYDLSHVGLTDELLAKVIADYFPPPTCLKLGDNPLLTDDGLSVLSHLFQLEELWLASNRQITDAGLRHLESLLSSSSGRLREIHLRGTAISCQGCDRLYQAASSSSSNARHRSLRIYHDLAHVHVHTQVPKMDLLERLEEKDSSLQEIILIGPFSSNSSEDITTNRGMLSYTRFDMETICCALEDTKAWTRLQRLFVSETFFTQCVDWRLESSLARMSRVQQPSVSSTVPDSMQQIVRRLMQAAVRLPSLNDLRIHWPSDEGTFGKRVLMPDLFQSLDLSPHPCGLKTLEISTGGNLVKYGRPQLLDMESLEILGNKLTHFQNLVSLRLKWWSPTSYAQIPDRFVIAKQEALSFLTDCSFSKMNRLASLHLECHVQRRPRSAVQSPSLLTIPTFIALCNISNLRSLTLIGMELSDEHALALSNECANKRLLLEEIILRAPIGAPDGTHSNVCTFSIRGLQTLRAMMEQQFTLVKLCFELLNESQYIYWSSMCEQDLLLLQGAEEDLVSRSTHEGLDESTVLRRKYFQAKIDSFCRLNAVGRWQENKSYIPTRVVCVDLLATVSHDLDALWLTMLRNPTVCHL